MSTTHRTTALSLYRAILQTHKKKLPFQLRLLGDAYVKEEWRAHRYAKPEHALQFLRQWTDYLVTLKKQKTVTGTNLSDNEIESLSPEQRDRLVALRESAETLT